MLVVAMVSSFFPLLATHAEETASNTAPTESETDPVEIVQEDVEADAEEPSDMAAVESDTEVATTAETELEPPSESQELLVSTSSASTTEEDTTIATTATTTEETIATSSGSAVAAETSTTSSGEFMLSGTTTPATTTTEGGDSSQTSAASTSTPVVIQSGEAIALANIINIINSNFVNSDGVVFFSNFLEAVMQSLDLRTAYESLTEFGCSLFACDDSSTTVQVSNTAAINNLLYLEAISGNNTINDAEAATIETGDAYAGLNLVNVANMNFIDSNYLLVTINAFDDFNGDIIFPSTEALLSNLASSPDQAVIDVESSGTIANEIDTNANSGDNTVDAEESSTITTGGSGASANVFNQLNNSLFGGQNITILFRVHGDWVGDVFGAPEDLVWQQTPDGNVLLFDTENSSPSSSGSHTLSVTADNDASISNQVQVVALTGKNHISQAETGLISTGNAFAGANIINLANGTVVGRNWILAIVNIFGDFNGNIAFGRPDLWVGEVISAPERIRDGTKVTYTFSVLNNGDSTATRVVLKDNYQREHLDLIESSLPYTSASNGELQFDLGSIPPGKGAEVSYTARVSGAGDSSVEITNVVSVSAREPDDNQIDNSDTATIVTTAKSRSNSTRTKVSREQTRRVSEAQINNEGKVAGIAADASALKVKRLFPGFPVSTKYPAMRQMITLVNDTDKIVPQVEYIDVLRDPSGGEVKREVWELGDVMPNEEIQLGYTLTFQSDAVSGIYPLLSQVVSGSGLLKQYENGTVSFSRVMAPSEVLRLSPVVDSVLVAEASAENMVDESSSELTEILVVALEPEFSLPSLSGHFVSTATKQQGGQSDGVANALRRFYSYVRSLVTRVAESSFMEQSRRVIVNVIN